MDSSVLFTDNFTKSVENTLDYITKDLKNPYAAKKLYINILDAISRIKKHPEMYARVLYEKYKKLNIRKVKINNYYLFYLYENKENKIFILNLVYSARNIEELDKLLNLN